MACRQFEGFHLSVVVLGSQKMGINLQGRRWRTLPHQKKRRGTSKPGETAQGRVHFKAQNRAALKKDNALQFKRTVKDAEISQVSIKFDTECAQNSAHPSGMPVVKALLNWCSANLDLHATPQAKNQKSSQSCTDKVGGGIKAGLEFFAISRCQTQFGNFDCGNIAASYPAQVGSSAFCKCTRNAKSACTIETASSSHQRLLRHVVSKSTAEHGDNDTRQREEPEALRMRRRV
ncbi:hypothetical protein B0H13DRAFT_1867033 [Mycena leptocephala]|nr:hypothetical protein B0H13DRAFT_1867033 [Mycena leptocephala]